jgi:hypothetical protein
MLKYEDLVILHDKVNLDAPKPGLDKQALKLSDETFQRLISANMINAGGLLTEHGRKTVVQLRATVGKLRQGVPFVMRVKTNAAAAERPTSSSIGWFTAEIKKKQYITNGALFLLGKPSKEMEAAPANAEQRQGIANAINSGTAGKKTDYAQLSPKVYQVAGIGGMELAWLFSEDDSIAMAIQAMFFDLIKERYPTATFWAHSKKAAAKETLVPIQARVTNRGLKNNVVALVMPVEVEWPAPKTEEPSGELSS